MYWRSAVSFDQLFQHLGSHQGLVTRTTLGNPAAEQLQQTLAIIGVGLIELAYADFFTVDRCRVNGGAAPK